LWLISSPALAQAHTGVITQIRIDSGAQPAVCVATAPAMPDGTWACFYSNRPGYLEMTQLLLKAFEAKLPCRFEWTQVDSMTSRARIEVLTCSAPR
jgi:hypothetical protein